MGRLIDIDDVKTLINAADSNDKNTIIAGLDALRTAYDVDEIIKQLKAWAFYADIKYPHSDDKPVNRNLILSETAVKIVKAGRDRTLKSSTDDIKTHAKMIKEHCSQIVMEKDCPFFRGYRNENGARIAICELNKGHCSPCNWAV